MAWGCIKVEEQRAKFIKEFLDGKESITSLCYKYQISRKTAYKWYNRFLLLEEEGLKDLSRAPYKTPQVYTDDQIRLAIDYKMQHRNWGPKKIIAKLKIHYPQLDWPSPTRLYEIFKDRHLVTKRRLRSRIPATAPLGDLSACNDTWAVDLKGWFKTGDGRKCEPLTITDCYSRYLIHCMHLNSHTAENVWGVFERAFLEYGLPKRIRSDNGPPFGCVGAGRLTKLSINLIKAGVIPEWIHPGHPEENGRHERFHLTLQQEVASPPKDTFPQQLRALKDFQNTYNFDRPHEALGMQTPANYYQMSMRQWDGILRIPEYDTKKCMVRKVGQSGCIHISQKEYYISQALTGEYVAIQDIENEKKEMYFGPISLGKFDLINGLEKPKLTTRRNRRN